MDKDKRIEATKRPIIITGICILGVVGLLPGLIALPTIFSIMAKQVGAWYPLYFCFSLIAGLICMVGLWKMKKWSIVVYTILAVINQIILITIGAWNPSGFFQWIIVIIGLWQYKLLV